MNRNVILSDCFSNPDSREKFQSRWLSDPDSAERYANGIGCEKCCYYCPLSGDFGLCSREDSDFFSETLHKNFNCSLLERSREANLPKNPLSKRALVADDETVIQGYLRDVLTSMGYIVDLVSSGRAAYSLGSIPYDLILVDFLMPDWDGITSMEMAKAFGNNSPVIVITGNPLALPDECPYPVLIKPVRTAELVEKIETISS